ncbi:MAG: co-chaperone GroES [Patescibacteria group bacterium]
MVKKVKKIKKTNKKSVQPIGKKNKAKKENKKVPIALLGDRVLIKELGSEEMFKTSASGIIIPDSGKDEGGKRGKVISVGPGKHEEGKLIPVFVKVGQTVLYTWGDKIKVSGEEYVIVRESEIIAVLNS